MSHGIVLWKILNAAQSTVLCVNRFTDYYAMHNSVLLLSRLSIN